MLATSIGLTIFDVDHSSNYVICPRLILQPYPVRFPLQEVWLLAEDPYGTSCMLKLFKRQLLMAWSIWTNTPVSGSDLQATKQAHGQSVASSWLTLTHLQPCSRSAQLLKQRETSSCTAYPSAVHAARPVDRMPAHSAIKENGRQ